MSERRNGGESGAPWRATVRITVVILLLWLITVCGTVFLAPLLERVRLFGFPLSFYMAAQGAVVTFVILVAVYAWRMNAIERSLEREDRR